MQETVKQFTESDWKKFRSKIADWQENYIQKLNEGYIDLLNTKRSSAENFWELEKRIKEDKRKPGVIVDMRRSTMIHNIMMMLRDGTITYEDLDDFSDTLKDTIRALSRRYEI